MSNGPSIVNVAALIGEQARACMLTALMGGEALTATELASEAGITKQTASSHLAKLVDGALIRVQNQGRHRYFQLASPDVATLLESLMGVARRTGAVRARWGPRNPAMRKARVCYDHLAGDLAVAVYDALVRRKLLHPGREGDESNTLCLSGEGESFFQELGIDLLELGRSRRPVCRPCLDWSARRHHLAGSLGKAVLELTHARGWAKRMHGTRVVRFSARGERALRESFQVQE